MTMDSGWDSLLGQIAVERGLLSSSQLATVMKEISPSAEGAKGAPLGATLVARKLISEKDLMGLLEEQSRRMQILESFRIMRKREFLIGQMLVQRNLATQNQINKCLEVQHLRAERGEEPIPKLGEMLVSYGYVDQAMIDEMLGLQNRGKETASGVNPPSKEK